MKKKGKYAMSGVNITTGDIASALAGKFSATTFSGRINKIGAPVKLPGGFAGVLDFGKFFIVTGDDGTGTKMAVAEVVDKFNTIGADLLAMVADDAVCLGAEVTSITNTLDCPKVEPKIIGNLLRGLAKYCREQKIIIAGGEIAEVGQTVNGLVWNATAIGVVEKTKIIDGSRIQPGNKIIALREHGLRSNGFSLARAILQKKFGKNWHTRNPGTNNKKTWGELLLTPSKIYHSAILNLIGRFGEKRKNDVLGIVHITGGGIGGNLPRIFHDKKLGAHFTNLWQPPAWITELIQIGKVSTEESREVWNLGNGMLIVAASSEAKKTVAILKKNKIEARIAGEITKLGKITFE